jgi:hypothetical protein
MAGQKERTQQTQRTSSSVEVLRKAQSDFPNHQIKHCVRLDLLYLVRETTATNKRFTIVRVLLATS